MFELRRKEAGGLYCPQRKHQGLESGRQCGLSVLGQKRVARVATAQSVGQGPG